MPLPPQDNVMPPTHVSVSNVSSLGLGGVSGVPSPSLGVSLPSMGRLDQLRDRGDIGLTSHIVSADVHSVPRSFASFDPSLLFPCSDSGFPSLSAPPPLSSFSASLSSSFSVASTFSSSALSSSTVPLYSLPSVVPSVLAPSLPLSSSSFSVAPPPGFASASPSVSSASLLGASAPSFPSSSSSAPPSFSRGSLPFSASSSLSSSASVPFSSSSSSAISPSQDFASFQASLLGLSAGYQALGHWYVSSGGRDFPSYLSAHFPHLYSDYRLDYSSGSSRFLSAVSSAPPAAPAPGPFVSSSSLPSSFTRAPLLPSASAWPSQSLSSLSLPVDSALSAPVPSHPLSLHPPLSSSTPALSSSLGFVEDSVEAMLAAVGYLAARAGAVGASSASPLFRPFAPSAPLPPPPLSCSAGAPPVSLPSASFLSASAFVPPPPPSAFGFVSSEDLPEDSPPDAVPRVLDPGFGSVPDSARIEFRRMLSFIVDLFPQAAGSPSVAPPPRALFEDFFSSATPSSPVFLNWFERVRSALSDADSRLAGFIASGRGDFLLLPSRSPLYAAHGDFAFKWCGSG